MAAEPTEKSKHRYAWPLGINLALLLLLVGLNWRNVSNSGLGLLLLACLNIPIGFVFLLFEWRRESKFASGFFLSFFLLLIIGFGMCARGSHPRHEVEIIEDPAEIH
ncbi:hypothetical protein JAO73_03735 [Hymenobacter sp. BT523]|uniref:hypothetical protein n=1 Tax=Hymenobacter sp. BT523 TaxID=2795725 RepID=UPI0018ECBE9B|nr:hypothetical protein [Hymenobacter sp. BT523]MBJ6108109.1 hypothetical protein [Hymenobacter sp. BT523]